MDHIRCINSNDGIFREAAWCKARDAMDAPTDMHLGKCVIIECLNCEITILSLKRKFGRCTLRRFEGIWLLLPVVSLESPDTLVHIP